MGRLDLGVQALLARRRTGTELDTATLTGGRMPPSLARWKRATTVAAAILAASKRGFQPRTSASVVVVSGCTRRMIQSNLKRALGRKLR